MKKSELELLKKLLEDRREQIIKNITDSTKDIEELRQSGAVDEFDMASINTDSNLEYSLSAKQRKELTDIDLSLIKIKNGTYGICEMCDESISVARLKAKPSAKLCMTCKEISEKNIS
ncbi:DnaK suppressor protein [Campylobacter blaseri]|uniref:Molecular chaperone DnaK suppressor DksA n=1 Tax=Campylobacter blaseri TaxID=2042961 RepID=A0A2P8QZA8_9BACT|nr:RNA polymerase-binding protein DksA [Campylobacter blaseri]PSM51584.1 molecular chaperone DnaK suppressor DksA [Campylobacter blaseri]PSM53377.1 molecular chaperone DnaK suppressor DksA [Campylobacter blaseri]QKF86672.1 DnaK suppressor protein [Campylobacter blaseri]